MTRKKRPKATDQPAQLPAHPTAADIHATALDRLAAVVHPELLLALQEYLPARDPAWVTLFAHAFDEDNKPSALLLTPPVSLNPPRFAVGSDVGDAKWVVSQLCRVFSAFPQRVGSWQARVSYQTIAELGEARCAALGRLGMGEVVGAVEAELHSQLPQVPTNDATTPFPVDRNAVAQAVDVHFAPCLARARVGAALEEAFPHEDDEELDRLVNDATGGLQMRAGPEPAFEVEVCAPGRPWLPLHNVTDALKRRLSTGFRVLQSS